jgi:phosphopantetheinyl transferase
VNPPAGGDAAPGSEFDRLTGLASACGIALVFVAVTEPGRAGDTAAGRRAAATALELLDATRPGHIARHADIGRHDDGRPAWPVGFTGSIAHAGDLAAAALATATLVDPAVADAPPAGGPGAERAVGVDVEVSDALPASDAALVLDDAERAAVAQAADPDRLATLLWSAKEAAYKAWHTATDGGLVAVDPVDIHIDLLPADPAVPDGLPQVRATANGRLAGPVEPVGALHGWWSEDAGYVAVLLTSARRAARASARGPHQGRDGIASAATT